MQNLGDALTCQKDMVDPSCLSRQGEFKLVSDGGMEEGFKKTWCRDGCE